VSVLADMPAHGLPTVALIVVAQLAQPAVTPVERLADTPVAQPAAAIAAAEQHAVAIAAAEQHAVAVAAVASMAAVVAAAPTVVAAADIGNTLGLRG